jgi:beta-N-acetylhexosaminidase
MSNFPRRTSFILLICLIITSLNLQAQTLRDKIGQMIWASFSGTKLHDTTKIDLQKRNLGGIILFAGNIKSPGQVKLLNDTIKMFSKTQPFIAVDQEGGRIARLSSSNGYKATNSAYRLGVIGKEDSTRKTAAMMAKWLKDGGFNIDLAPVADVNVNPASPAIGKLERSFSKNPDSVYYHTKWFIDEFNELKILTSLKHFPGHGSAVSDSHLGFTDITKTWSEAELIPYTSLFVGGYDGLVMLGHLFNKNLDPVYPASLSKNVVTNLLRNQLGFKGVTITDGMSMQAITNNYGFEESIEFAVNAGVDILLYEYNLKNGSSLVRQIEEIIEQKVKQGKISTSRIDESYNRIIELKKKYGIIENTSDLEEKNIPSEFSLSQNYPNPFNPETTISYKIQAASNVSLKVYDVLGREVVTLVDEYKQAGSYNCKLTRFDSRLARRGIENGELSSGVYFYRLATPTNSITKKMVLVK